MADNGHRNDQEWGSVFNVSFLWFFFLIASSRPSPLKTWSHPYKRWIKIGNVEGECRWRAWYTQLEQSNSERGTFQLQQWTQIDVLASRRQKYWWQNVDTDTSFVIQCYQWKNRFEDYSSTRDYLVVIHSSAYKIIFLLILVFFVDFNFQYSTVANDNNFNGMIFQCAGTKKYW